VRLILGGAAIHRCDKSVPLEAALAAEELNFRNVRERHDFSRAVKQSEICGALALKE
jgi:hypothetical protein